MQVKNLAVLGQLGVEKADVLGYSMGGSTAVALAIRHPDKVGKQIILSATARLDGWYPEVLAGIAKLRVWVQNIQNGAVGCDCGEAVAPSIAL